MRKYYYEPKEPTRYLRGIFIGAKETIFVFSLIANYFFYHATAPNIVWDEPLPPASKAQQVAKAKIEQGDDLVAQLTSKGGR